VTETGAPRAPLFPSLCISAAVPPPRDSPAGTHPRCTSSYVVAADAVARLVDRLRAHQELRLGAARVAGAWHRERRLTSRGQRPQAVPAAYRIGGAVAVVDVVTDRSKSLSTPRGSGVSGGPGQSRSRCSRPARSCPATRTATFKWPYPGTEEIRQKTSYIATNDEGFFCGVGAYK